MEKTGKTEKLFGLLGKNISYSFSRGYFANKFEQLGLLDCAYVNFDLPNLESLKEVFEKPNLKGLNVTIPYKEDIIPHLDELDATASHIGAVNTIKPTSSGFKGYNTDAYGFQKAIEPHLNAHHTKALVLGTGGASKAVVYALQQLQLEVALVSRDHSKANYSYEDLTQTVLEAHTVVVNCTPLGTFPNVVEKPQLSYENITEKHILFDLVYNPEKTAFLAEGELHGAKILNGLKMLELQAEKAWEIWNS
ncbi:MAG: shikimate dehydrogenase [Bacteroidota bacterium]